MKRKLLYICKFNPYTHIGGAAIRNRSILELLKTEYEISLASFSIHEADLARRDEGLHCLKYKYDLIEGVLRTRSLSAARFYSRAMAELIRQLTISDDFAVIYISELVMFQSSGIAAGQRKKRIA
jgi:hypothetical protein